MASEVNQSKIPQSSFPLFTISFVILLTQWLNPNVYFPLWILVTAWVVLMITGIIILIAFLIGVGVAVEKSRKKVF